MCRAAGGRMIEARHSDLARADSAPRKGGTL
jgi:hypothetical protein